MLAAGPFDTEIMLEVSERDGSDDFGGSMFVLRGEYDA